MTIDIDSSLANEITVDGDDVREVTIDGVHVWPDASLDSGDQAGDYDITVDSNQNLRDASGNLLTLYDSSVGQGAYAGYNYLSGFPPAGTLTWNGSGFTIDNGSTEYAITNGTQEITSIENAPANNGTLRCVGGELQLQYEDIDTTWVDRTETETLAYLTDESRYWKLDSSGNYRNIYVDGRVSAANDDPLDAGFTVSFDFQWDPNGGTSYTTIDSDSYTYTGSDTVARDANVSRKRVSESQIKNGIRTKLANVTIQDGGYIWSSDSWQKLDYEEEVETSVTKTTAVSLSH